jgi:thiamine biosynthesis lipoprotein ApbE
MKTSFALAAAGVIVALAGAAGLATSARVRTFTSDYDNVLGTSLELKVNAVSQATADRAESAVLAEIARDSSLLSAWDKNSEFSRWAVTHDQPVRVSPELFDVLNLFDTWRTRTHGALDAGAETILRVWTAAAAAGRVPTSTELGAAVDQLRQPQWTLDRVTHTATRVGGAPLVLASFTKSYIIDKAAAAAMAIPGVNAVVVNIGGDIAVRGAVTEPVEIVDPQSGADNAPAISQIVVKNGAVATSGNYRRGFDIAGVHYSHIVDARTGLTADDVISSTVVAPNPADAGALATAFSILAPDERTALATSLPGVEYLVIDKNGRRTASAGWNALEASARRLTGSVVPAPEAVQATSGAAWDPSMELAINFEIPVMYGPAKRPFIAAWIEDADRFPVKTLALWYHEDRYLTEMKAWYRADRLRSMSERRSIARTVGSATRSPGKYTLKWDGRDNDGKPVAPGKYTVYLEVAREHGGYELRHEEMTFAGTPQAVNFKPGTEIAAANFDYHKIAR